MYVPTRCIGRHHISSIPRRVRLIREVMRVVAVGGKGLFYAWAFEQKNAKSGHQFPAHDVLVPWHLKPANEGKGKKGEKGKGGKDGNRKGGREESGAGNASSKHDVGGGDAGADGDVGASADGGTTASRVAAGSDHYSVLLPGTINLLGLSISTDSEMCIHRVSKLLEGSPAATVGAISLGDMLVEVSGSSVVGLKHEDVIGLIQAAGEAAGEAGASAEVAMVFLPAAANPPAVWQPAVPQAEQQQQQQQAPSSVDADPSADEEAVAAAAAADHEEEEPQVFQRYCHVYKEGELDKLASLIPEVEVVESYYDTGNWCLVLRKIKTMDPANDFKPLPVDGYRRYGGGGGGVGGGGAAMDGVAGPMLDVSQAMKDLLDLSEGTAMPDAE